jgi:hypothetical protein
MYLMHCVMDHIDEIENMKETLPCIGFRASNIGLCIILVRESVKVSESCNEHLPANQDILIVSSLLGTLDGTTLREKKDYQTLPQTVCSLHAVFNELNLSKTLICHIPSIPDSQ